MITIFSLIFMLSHAPKMTVLLPSGSSILVNLPDNGNALFPLLAATSPKIGKVENTARFFIGTTEIHKSMQIEEILALGDQEITMVNSADNQRLILPLLSRDSNWTIVCEGNLELIRIPNNPTHTTLTDHISFAQRYVFKEKSKQNPVRMQDILNFNDLFCDNSYYKRWLSTAVSYHLHQIRIIHKREADYVEYILLRTNNLDGIEPTNSFKVIDDLENPIFHDVQDFRHSIEPGLQSILLLLKNDQGHTITQQSIDGQELESLGMGNMSYIPQAWKLTETNYYPDHPLFHGNLMSN